MAGEYLLSALRQVWATLAVLKIDVALMGGIAVAAWKHVRNTRDVDLLVGVRRSEADKLLQCLKEAGFKLLRQPPFLTIGESYILQSSFVPAGKFLDIRIDLFLAESEYEQVALSRRVEMKFPGLDDTVSILSCEDLILFKLSAGRILDRSDCAYLLRFNRETLDLAYLWDWAEKLQIKAQLDEIWHEAFSEPNPPPA
jgi:hypothetical protein